MATSTTVWRIRVGGTSGNGAGFDPTTTMATDLAATSATGNSPIVTSVSYTFVAGDVGAYLFIQSGTNWLSGWYKITSVSAGAATLNATIGSVAIYQGSPSLLTTGTGALNIIAGCATTTSPTGGVWSIDYSQQNSSQISFTDLVIDATTNTKCTSVLHPFSVNHVGNVLNITAGTGFTVQHVTIISISSGVATCNTALGTVSSSGGVAKLGGAKSLPVNVGGLLLAGNIVYILGILGNATSYPTTVDYSTTNFITPNAGSSSGYMKWIADPNGPMPTLQSDGLYFNGVSYHWFEGLYFTCSSTSNGSYGIINGNSLVVKSCIFNLQNRAVISAVGGMSNNALGGCTIIGNEIYGGSLTPSLSGSVCALSLGTYCNFVAYNYIHHIGGIGIYDSSSTTHNIIGNVIYKCQGDSIYLKASGSSSLVGSNIISNIIDAGLGNGILLSLSGSSQCCNIFNNIITNHTGTGKYAINAVSGTSFINDSAKRIYNYNCLYNNTSNYQNISAGPNDLINVDPQYNNVSGGDWTPKNSALKSAMPTLIFNTNTNNFAWRGPITPTTIPGPTYFSH